MKNKKTKIVQFALSFFLAATIYLMPIASQALVLSTGSGSSSGPCANTGLDDLASIGIFPHYCTANSLMVKIVTFAFAIIAMVSALFIVYGGFMYITSAGNPDRAKKGTSTLTYALIGLVVAILAYTLVAIIVNTASNGVGAG